MPEQEHTEADLEEMRLQAQQPSLAAKVAYINALEWHRVADQRRLAVARITARREGAGAAAALCDAKSYLSHGPHEPLNLLPEESIPVLRSTAEEIRAAALDEEIRALWEMANVRVVSGGAILGDGAAEGRVMKAYPYGNLRCPKCGDVMEWLEMYGHCRCNNGACELFGTIWQAPSMELRRVVTLEGGMRYTLPADSPTTY